MLKKILIAASLLAIASLAQGQTLDFTLSASSSDGRTVVPRLTWSTTPAATTCTASGSWSGSKAASGTQTLSGVTASQSYVLQCNWPGATIAVVNWTKPTTNTDGTAYTNPNGYRIQYGNTGATEAQLTQSVYLSEAQSVTPTWTSPTLAPGTWYFGVKAVNTLGLESALSNVASKAMTAGTNQNRTLELAIKVPGAPVINLE